MRRARRARGSLTTQPISALSGQARPSGVSRAETRLRDGARQILGRELSATETGSLIKYLYLLRKWNTIYRLVGSSEISWLVDNVVLDSLLFLQVLPDGARSVGDLGSGAGVPGIPIKIVRPDLEMVLIESRRRPASFLSTAVRELGLTAVRVHNARAESLVDTLGGSLDAVVARCAGTVVDVVRSGLVLVRPSGRLVISGPPEGRRLGIPPGLSWQWVEPRATGAGKTRRFLVCLKS